LWDRNEEEELSMADFYDRDAYNCLVIAVLKGVGASKAIRLYWNDPETLSQQGKIVRGIKEKPGMRKEKKKNDDIE